MGGEPFLVMTESNGEEQDWTARMWESRAEGPGVNTGNVLLNALDCVQPSSGCAFSMPIPTSQFSFSGTYACFADSIYKTLYSPWRNISNIFCLNREPL